MENKKKFTPYVYLVLFNCFIFSIFYGKLGNFFFDISRELYLPSAINAGFVLYKDIFNVYAPLGYQLNSFISYIFGNGFNTFYFMGIINAILISFAIYLISSLFLKQIHSLILCSFIIVSCFFTNAISNYILPYSYSMVYSLNAFLWSLYCLLFYLNNSNKKYLYASFLFFGASIAFKYDFMFFGIVLAFFFFYRTSFNDKIYSFFSFLIIPLLSLADLFIKGVTLNDIKISADYMIYLAKSNSVEHLYKLLGLIPNFGFIKGTFKDNIFSLFSIIILVFQFYMFILFKERKGIKYICFNIINFCFFAFALVYLSSYYSQKGAFIFCLSPLLISIFTLYFLIKKHMRFDENDKLYFVLAVSSILASSKCLLNISFSTYGNYYLPFIFICIIVFLSKYTSGNENIQRKIQNSISFCLCSLAFIFFISNYSNAFIYKTEKLVSNKGIFYTDKKYSYVINKVCDYIRENTTKEDRVLVVPDGAMINYMTDRISDNKFYSLTPPNVEIFEDTNIIKELKTQAPEYIVIQPMMFMDYGYMSFCSSYGSKICKYIYENYERKEYIEDSTSLFWMSVYKKRK